MAAKRRDPVIPTGITNRIEAESILVAELAEAMYRERGTESDLGDDAWSEYVAHNVMAAMATDDRRELRSALRRIGAICLRWTIAIDLGMPSEPASQEPLPF